MGLEDGLNSHETAMENQEDMLVAAGKDLTGLLMLKKCYVEMIAIARPYADRSGKIQAPANRLPFERISKSVADAVNNMDGAFIETMAMTEFLGIFEEGLAGVIKKIEKAQKEGGGLGRDLR